MCLDIKRLDTCISGLFGGICAYINLDDYADTDSVKCEIANIGEEIIPDMFAYDGTPYFSYDLFKKYSKDDHYAHIYVEVKYDSKKLELDEAIFNTSRGINDYIVSLDTLRNIMHIRSVAYHKKKMSLDEFVWKGILKFDQFGQTMFLSEQTFLSDIPYRIMNGTVDAYTFVQYCTRWSGTFRNIPQQNDICPHCGEKWTLNPPAT